MNHPSMISHICLNCSFRFLAFECENYVREKDMCEGCETAHCCRECGSYDTRPKTKEEAEEEERVMLALMEAGKMYVPPERHLFQCGDCGLQFTQRQCASHTNKYQPEENRYPTCDEDCKCNGGAKDSIHRCPQCFTLNAPYFGPISKMRF